jgi:hypothetical protein
VGYRRGTLLIVALGVVSLAGCSADVSHPSALGSASSAPPAAAPRSPVAVSAPPSPAASSAAAVIASPSFSGTPTSTAAEDASPPTSADVIATHVRATAQAFVDDFNVALATGDTTKIEALTAPTCGCRKLVNTIKQIAAKGEHFDGVSFTLKSTDVTFHAAGASGEIRYTVSPGRVLDAAGKQVNTTRPTPDGDNDLFIINANGRWIVQQSTLLGASDQW